MREEWSLGCAHSCPSACIVQCQLRHLSDPHHATHGARGQWIKLGSKFDRVSGIPSKLAPFFLPAWTCRVWKPLCTWYWSSTHRCYQREGFFEEEGISAWQPQDAPNWVWRSQPESLVCQVVIHSPTCSTFPGNFIWDTCKVLLNLGTVYKSHLQTEGTESLTPQKNWRWVAPFSHTELWKMLLQNNMNLATTRYTTKASFRELGERAGCKSSFG